MLKKEQLATFVKQNFSTAVQIDHLNRSPSSIQTRLYPPPHSAIPNSATPSTPCPPTPPKLTSIR